MLEFSYLSARKSSVYQLIMDMFLSEFEKFNLKFTLEEVYEKLTSSDYGSHEIDISNLMNDLNYLVDNHNLSVRLEDEDKITSLESYKNRTRYYSITQSGLFVARSVRAFLNESHKTVLCDEYFERIIQDIKQCKRNPGQISNWDMLFNDARLVFQIYQDFLSSGSEIDKITTSSEFLAYKDNFVNQIHLLIDKLSKYSDIISKQLEELEFKDQRFDQLKNWFLYNNNNKPVYMTVLRYCSYLIEKVTRTARLLTDMSEYDTDFMSVLRNLKECQTLKDCHSYFETMMGIQSINHFNFHDDFIPVIREKAEEETVEEEKYNDEEKLDDEGLSLKVYDMELKKEKSLLSLSDSNNVLALSEISGRLTGDQLFTYLGWVSDAMNSGEDKGVTVGGENYHLLKKEDRKKIVTETGELELPDISIVFSE